MRLFAAVAVAALTLAAAAAAEAKTVHLTASRLVDVRTGKVIENPAVVIVDGKVTAAGPAASVTAPAGAERVDLPGVTLLPGLIDMHTHIDSPADIGGYRYLEYGDRFWSVIQVRHAEDTLRAGFTTIRNLGSSDWNDVGLRQAISEGRAVGPRIVSAGYSFGATGGHCDSTFFPPSMNEVSPYNVDSPEEGRKRVREVRKYGAQVIKICATGGVFSRNTEPGQQQLSLAEMKAIVEEAHMWGLKVAAHAHGAAGIKDAIRAGVDTIEHASLIDDEGIRLAREHGAWLSMDIYNTEYTQAEGKKNGVLEDNLRKDREVADVQREGFRKAVKAGVKMVYGTDSGIYPHGDNGKQFVWMVRYGMTPLQAIQSATINAAEALGQSGQVGVVAPGAWGDIIGVTGDPLADVAVLERPVFVMKGGDVVVGVR